MAMATTTMGNQAAGAASTPNGHALRSNGRLAANGLTDTERNYSIFSHLALYATALVLPPLGCVAPVIMWLVMREKSAFIDDHGRELTNVVITGAIATLALGFIPILGWIALAGWYVVIAINVVRGAMAAGRGEYFRYPMIIRFLS